MNYRLGTIEDVNAIVSLIRDVIKEMERHEIYQWDEIYPTAEDFTTDIIKENPYAQRLYRHNGYEVRGYAEV